MQIKDVLKKAISDLRGSGNTDTPRLDAELLMMHVTHFNQVQLITHDTDKLGTLESTVFNALIQKRIQGQPIAHLLGRRDFWKLTLKVTADTLIPRPDTEVLVEKAITLIECNKFQTVLDLGTGSGAIILALKHDLPYIKAHAVDFSENALQVALENARTLGLDVKFYMGSWFEALNQRVKLDENGVIALCRHKNLQHSADVPLEGKVEEPRFDMIVSNPPYIGDIDPHLTQGDVRFEPMSALVSGEDGLQDIRLIVSQSGKYLNEGGYLLLEHGYNQGHEVRELLRAAEFENIETIKDYGLNERVTLGRYYTQHGTKILSGSSSQ